MSEKISIEIQKELADKIQKRVDESEFNSISEYVAYVLEQVVVKLEAEKPKEEAYSKEDEEKVKERLRGLGYME